MSIQRSHRRPARRTAEQSVDKSIDKHTHNRPLSGYASLVGSGGATTHIVVPIEEYERLIVADMARTAIQKLEDPNTEWIDARDLGIEFARDAIVEVRKKAGLTQKQLGQKLGLPQSQISRIERRPDRTTVRTLRRLARALKVDVRVFLRGL